MKELRDLLEGFKQIRASAPPLVDRTLVPVVSIHQHIPVPARRARQQRRETDHPVMVRGQDTHVWQPVMPDSRFEFRDVGQGGIRPRVAHGFQHFAMFIFTQG